MQVLEMQRHAKVAGLFSLRLHEQSPIKLEQQISTERQSGRDDIALVLHTSGTTKKPKIAALPVYICVLSISYLLRKPADRLGKVVFANEVSIGGVGGWTLPSQWARNLDIQGK